MFTRRAKIVLAIDVLQEISHAWIMNWHNVQCQTEDKSIYKSSKFNRFADQIASYILPFQIDGKPN